MTSLSNAIRGKPTLRGEFYWQDEAGKVTPFRSLANWHADRKRGFTLHPESLSSCPDSRNLKRLILTRGELSKAISSCQ